MSLRPQLQVNGVTPVAGRPPQVVEHTENPETGIPYKPVWSSSQRPETRL
jgi:hypothetical protein